MKPFIKLFVVIVCTFWSEASFGQCGCTFTLPLSTSTITFDGVAKGAKPGDVICLTPGSTQRLVFNNLKGSATNYIKITNCGGQTLVGSATANTAINFSNSQFIHLTGAGDPNTLYGIKVPESKASSMGVSAYNLSSDFQIDHLEITKVGFAGIMVKSDPSPDCLNKIYERPNFTMQNINIHDNYIHDISGEGIYCGNSFYPGTSIYCGSTQYCHEVRSVKVHHNIFENTGWEAIQIGAGVDDINVYDNKVTNYGQANVSGQNGGIQLGQGATGRIYNNIVKGGSGRAIFMGGIGNYTIFNNILISNGVAGSAAAISMSITKTPLPTDIVPTNFAGPVRIINNTFIDETFGSIKESLPGPLGNVLFNNLIVGGAPAWLSLRGDTDWTKSNNVYIANIADAKFVNPALDDYRLATGSPAINAGKDVSAYGVTFDHEGKPRPVGAIWDVGAFELPGNQKPAVAVGANQSIILPTNTTTIVGSASDPDGTIASYLWSKQTGPTATLANTTTTTLTVSNLVVGIYVFRLTATDNGGETGFKDMTVTVIDPAINQAPVANAGANKTITLPTNTTVLTGSGSDPDGTITTYLWTKFSGPAATLANANTASLTVSGLVQGTYVFRLTVTDDKGATDFKDATVTVNAAAVNQAPVASAGADKSMVLPTNSITLTGSGSDADGSIATYIWTKQTGGAATLTNATTVTLQLTGLVQGTYVFRLTVTDNLGATGFDEVSVIVSAANQAPLASAGVDKTIQLPANSTTLAGTGSDSDGSVSTYLWTKLTGPTATLTNPTNATLSLTNLLQGIYTFRLTVTDNSGANGSDDMILTVQAANVAPTANAGSQKNITLPVNSTTLTGSGTDVDGTIASYLWEKLSGPTGTFTGTNQATLTLTNLVVGTYTFRLTVTDNQGATGTSQVSVVLFPASVNQSPIVNGGVDVSLTLPTNSTTLTSVASDPDGTIVSYLWEKTIGPAATLSGSSTSALALTNLVAGAYTFRVTVTDNIGATASDQVLVNVSTINQIPVVNAGSTQTIVLPTNSTTITAVATDPDGTIASYLWANTSGPAAPTLSGTTTSTLTVGGLVAGNYVFRITVTDNAGATASTDVTVNVQTPTNVNPSANAGADVVLFLPTNSVNITGSGTDADGTVASYAWIKVTGPAATLTNANTKTLSISSLLQGVYTFRLTVTDNLGGTGIDDVTVTVNTASQNQLPVADAGPDVTISLPTNSATLTGSGTDSDGSIIGYAWEKVSGPTVTMVNQNTPVLSIQALVQGTYIFKLTVTGDTGATASDNIQVTVLPSGINQSPTVLVGSDVTINLPVNTHILTASASDPDGTIASYAWTKQSGPTVTQSGNTQSTLTLTNLLEGIYVFRITVTDNIGASSFDEATITVLPVIANEIPMVNAGADKILFLPTNSTNLNGVASDADGTIASYSWIKISGPTVTIVNETTPVVTLSSLLEGQYVFRLTATDNSGATAFDEVSITVFASTVNQPPIANAGEDKTIVLPNSTILLQGSGSDPDGGSIVKYTWTKKTGSTCVLENASLSSLIVTELLLGVYEFELMVEDNNGAIGTDMVKVFVIDVSTNQPPVADAGPDIFINLPQNSLDIQGAGSDPDGTIASYLWIKKTGPPSGTLSGQNTSKLSLTSLVAGSYQFLLSVTDDKGLTSIVDDVTVTVIDDAVNVNPTVTLGEDLFERLPLTSLAISADATDPDGAIASYLWTKKSGPAATISGATSPDITLTNLVEGIYVFRVQVTDNLGAIGSDEITVTINTGVNIPPVVTTPAIVSIVLPTTAASINGTVSDTDGTIADIVWAQQAGPTTATLAGLNLSTLEVSNLSPGSYKFRLTATDNEGATAFAETNLLVSATNSPPIAFAGKDSTITLPFNSLLLDGSGSDQDGFITTYSWTPLDGPTGITVNTDLLPLLTLSNLTEGVYNFRLTVTDNAGATATDDVTLTVKSNAGNPTGASVFFSPNGDDKNPVWVIKNISLIKDCPIIIFNRLGVKVYESANYQNDWDGTYNGARVAEGDYYYVCKCETAKYSGALRLLR